MPVRPQGSTLLRLFLLGLLGVGVYGGYYGYCRYQVGEKVHLVSQESEDLHQILLRMNKTISPADVRQVVLDLSRKAQVAVRPEDIQVTIEPLNQESVQKLPSVVQMGLSMAAKIPGTSQDSMWVVGYKMRFVARHGVAKQHFESERYTYLPSAEP
jgi:hypothetical protein